MSGLRLFAGFYTPPHQQLITIAQLIINAEGAGLAEASVIEVDKISGNALDFREEIRDCTGNKDLKV